MYKLPGQTSVGSWAKGEAPAAKSFGACWVLQVSSPAVLLCKAVRNQLKDLAYYCGIKKILSLPRFPHCGGERSPFPPAFPTPLINVVTVTDFFKLYIRTLFYYHNISTITCWWGFARLQHVRRHLPSVSFYTSLHRAWMCHSRTRWAIIRWCRQEDDKRCWRLATDLRHSSAGTSYPRRHDSIQFHRQTLHPAACWQQRYVTPLMPNIQHRCHYPLSLCPHSANLHCVQKKTPTHIFFHISMTDK